MFRVELSKETLQETSIFVSRTSGILVLYILLKGLFPLTSKLPLIICTLLFSTVLGQTQMLQSMKRRIARMSYEINEVKPLTLSKDRHELIASVYDLKMYISHAKQWNNRRRVLFRQMSLLQQNLTQVIEYPKKLNTIDMYFEKNYELLQEIAKLASKKYNIEDFEYKIVEEQATLKKRNNYYRVVESICHYSRDWAVEPCREIEPLLQYIRKQCSDLNSSKTLAIVPGSGLGRIAHSLATETKFSSVHAVEYSWLMVLMNEFIYSKVSSEKVKIYPYLHTYSNHLSLMDQIRSVEIQHSIKLPQSLQIHHGDFTEFDILTHLKIKESPENLVLVTCFFLDTAENLIEYLQTINRISDNFHGTVRWINVGPLKFGTAAKIEVSNEELKMLIQSMGWKFTDEQKPQLLGYLTDTLGLWQGYYNVTMWTAEKLK